jgi:hypothetical protein
MPFVEMEMGPRHAVRGFVLEMGNLERRAKLSRAFPKTDPHPKWPPC